MKPENRLDFLLKLRKSVEAKGQVLTRGKRIELEKLIKLNYNGLEGDKGIKDGTEEKA